MGRSKWEVGDHVYVRKATYRNRPCVITRFKLGEYEVTFTDRQHPTWAVVETASIVKRVPDQE
jgi:hypothetical protein